MQSDERDPRYLTQTCSAGWASWWSTFGRTSKKWTSPSSRRWFETSAEVLSGLIKAFRDYELKNEPAWR